jgi:oligopeptidase B
VRLIPAADPLAKPILVARARRASNTMSMSATDTLFIHTNDSHENFRLATAPLGDPGEWTTLIEGRDDFYLTGFELFRDFYVVEGRARARPDRGAVLRRSARIEPIVFPEASYSAGLGDNPEWATTCCACPMNRWSARHALRL